MLNKLGYHTHFQFSANQITWSRLLIQCHILNGKQCRSRLIGFFRSQPIRIYTVCKDGVYLGSAGQGLNKIYYFKFIFFEKCFFFYYFVFCAFHLCPFVHACMQTSVAQLDVRSTGDQEVAVRPQLDQQHSFRDWRLIMKYCLRSFSPPSTDSSGMVGWCVYHVSLGQPADIGLQLGKACYPCSR